MTWKDSHKNQRQYIILKGSIVFHYREVLSIIDGHQGLFVAFYQGCFSKCVCILHLYSTASLEFSSETHIDNVVTSRSRVPGGREKTDSGSGEAHSVLAYAQTSPGVLFLMSLLLHMLFQTIMSWRRFRPFSWLPKEWWIDTVREIDSHGTFVWLLTGCL